MLLTHVVERREDRSHSLSYFEHTFLKKENQIQHVQLNNQLGPHRKGIYFVLEFNFKPEGLTIITSGTTWEGERVEYHTGVSWHQMIQPCFPVLVPEEEEVVHVSVVTSDWTTGLHGVQYRRILAIIPVKQSLNQMRRNESNEKRFQSLSIRLLKR